MYDQIKVHVVKFKARRNLVMRYFDRLTNKQVSRTSKTPRRRDAERRAERWERELRTGQYQKPTHIAWKDFRERYKIQRLATLSKSTLQLAGSAFNHLERVLKPQLLEGITTAEISRFQQVLTAGGMKPTTLACHLRSIKAALNWAKRQGLLREVPTIEMPRGAKGIDCAMRGRPITAGEFSRMLTVIPRVRKHEPEKWRRLLRGLWLSGLRLGEALQLSWDADAAVSVQIDGKYPKLRFLAEGHKARRDQLLAITPDFGAMLLETPEDQRHGLVFEIEGDIPGKPLLSKTAVRVISAAGVVAKVEVDPVAGKFASAHDLRRSFAARWAKKLMPADLKQLMRHNDIATTMRYYVGVDSDVLAAGMWAADGNGPGNNGGEASGETLQASIGNATDT